MEPAPERRILGVTKTVFVLGLVSMFADVSSEMVYPVVPIFLASVLGISKSLIGLIEGVAESTASLSTFMSGWLSDRIRRRKALTGLGYSFGVFTRPLLGLATVWPQALSLRFLDRLGKGIRTSPRDALIADVSPAAERGRAFGFHRTLDTLGAIVGPAVAFLLLRFLIGRANYRDLFILAGIPALVAVVILFAFVRERTGGPLPVNLPRFSLSNFSAPFKLYILIVGLFAIGNSSNVFLLLRATNLGVPAYLATLLYLTFNVSYAIFALPAGMMSDRIGRRAVLVAGYLTFGLVYLGLALISRPVYLLPLFIFYGLYPGLTDAVQRAFAADLSPAALRGTGLGLYHFVVGLGALPASFIGGALWDRIGPPATFYFGAVTALASALILVVVFPMVAKK